MTETPSWLDDLFDDDARETEGGAYGLPRADVRQRATVRVSEQGVERL